MLIIRDRVDTRRLRYDTILVISHGQHDDFSFRCKNDTRRYDYYRMAAAASMTLRA